MGWVEVDVPQTGFLPPDALTNKYEYTLPGGMALHIWRSVYWHGERVPPFYAVHLMAEGTVVAKMRLQEREGLRGAQAYAIQMLIRHIRDLGAAYTIAQETWQKEEAS